MDGHSGAGGNGGAARLWLRRDSGAAAEHWLRVCARKRGARWRAAARLQSVGRPDTAAAATGDNLSSAYSTRRLSLIFWGIGKYIVR